MTPVVHAMHVAPVVIPQEPFQLIDLYSPVEITDISLQIEPKSGWVQATLTAVNVSLKVISAMRLHITCFNSMGEKVRSSYNAVQVVDMQDEHAAPKTVVGKGKPIDLSVLPDTRRIEVVVTRVAFLDGSLWEKGDYPLIQRFEQVRPTSPRDLVVVAGYGAIGYPHVDKDFWVCVCGRHSPLLETTCLRCGRDKALVLENFSNAETVATLLGDRGAQEERREQEEMDELVKSILAGRA